MYKAVVFAVALACTTTNISGARVQAESDCWSLFPYQNAILATNRGDEMGRNKNQCGYCDLIGNDFIAGVDSAWFGTQKNAERTDKCGQCFTVTNLSNGKSTVVVIGDRIWQNTGLAGSPGRQIDINKNGFSSLDPGNNNMCVTVTPVACPNHIMKRVGANRELFSGYGKEDKC